MRYLLVEGITDVQFIKYICVKYNITKKYNDFKKNENNNPDIDIYEFNDLKIINIAGQNNLEYVLTNIIKVQEIKIEKLAIIQDADGNFNTSLDLINKAIENSKVTKTLIPKENIFLMPNNKDFEGDLETLLLSTLDKSKIPQLKCFEGYKNCLNEHLDISTKYMNKGEVYSYTMFEKDGKDNYTPQNSFMYKKGKKYLDTDLWDLSKEKFQPIINFVLEIFKK